MGSLISRTQATPPALSFRARPSDSRSSSDRLGGLGTQLLCASGVLTVRWESSTCPQEERDNAASQKGTRRSPESWPLWPLWAQPTSEAFMGTWLFPFVKCFLKSLETHSVKPYYPNEGIATSRGCGETRVAHTVRQPKMEFAFKNTNPAWSFYGFSHPETESWSHVKLTRPRSKLVHTYPCHPPVTLPHTYWPLLRATCHTNGQLWEWGRGVRPEWCSPCGPSAWRAGWIWLPCTTSLTSTTTESGPQAQGFLTDVPDP